MSEVTSILEAAGRGDPQAAERLLPLVYDELRKLAAAKLAHEKPGQTLQATALVHDAYLRLVDVKNAQQWDSRGHFFAAAAEAMRRILVENARRKGRYKHGGNRERVALDQLDPTAAMPTDDVLAINEALTNLEAEDSQAALLVKLRFFAGLSLTEDAEALGISRTSAYEQWSYARAWLRCALASDDSQLAE
jgi:RNA polymerase sigma factor (TIGR02999 family)